MKAAFYRFLAAGGVIFAGAALAHAAEKTFERDITPGRVGPAASAPRGSSLDPAATAVHAPPARPTKPEPPNTAALLAQFTQAYEAAGAPRVAILYNQTFARQITSWTMDATRTALRMPAAVATRPGYTTENLQWIFEEGFAKPFMAAGVKLVDPAFVVQAASRKDNQRANGQQVFDLNANIDALRQHTDWLVEVLMVADSTTSTGYLFRTTLKRLSDGRIIASGVNTLDEFKAAPERTKAVYDETGYRFVPEEPGKPTVDDYAQSLAVKLLVDLTPKLPQFAVAKP